MNEKKFYVGYNSYGTSVSYNSDGWTVLAFTSSKARSAWLDKNAYNNGGVNQVAEAITAATARKIERNLDSVRVVA